MQKKTTQIIVRKPRKPNNKQNLRKKPKRLPRERLRAQFSNCARQYLHALINPFVQIHGSDLPCIPDHIVLPSNKIQVTARGSMAIGTAGFGFVIADPYTGINGATLGTQTTTNAAVIYTGSNYSLPTINISVAAGTLPTGVFTAATNSPYNSTSLPLTAADVRLVGCGLRIKYSGTELNRGGTIAIARSQDNSSFPNGGNVSNFLQSPLSAMSSVTRSWKSVCYAPASLTDVSYQPFAFYNANVGGTSHYSLAFAVQGPASTSNLAQTFDFEYVAYYEMIGTNLQLSPSHSDPVGVGAIQAVTANAKLSDSPPEVQEQTALSKIGQYLLNGMSGLAKQGANAALSYVTKTMATDALKMIDIGAPLLLTL